MADHDELDDRRAKGPRPYARLVTPVAVVLAVGAAFLLAFPFSVTADGVTARCGPPLFEVLVPADAAFDGPENALCGSPAGHRVLVGVVLAVAFVALAVSRRWQAGATARRARRRRHRRGPGRPAARDRAAPRPPSGASTPS